MHHNNIADVPIFLSFSGHFITKGISPRIFEDDIITE
jgi:hypothetical protein